MAFKRKDFLLIVGVLFFLIGLMGVGLPPIYAIIISLTIYFGIRIFVGRRKKMIEESVGEGICVINAPPFLIKLLSFYKNLLEN